MLPCKQCRSMWKGPCLEFSCNFILTLFTLHRFDYFFHLFRVHRLYNTRCYVLRHRNIKNVFLTTFSAALKGRNAPLVWAKCGRDDSYFVCFEQKTRRFFNSHSVCLVLINAFALTWLCYYMFFSNLEFSKLLKLFWQLFFQKMHKNKLFYF